MPLPCAFLSEGDFLFVRRLMKFVNGLLREWLSGGLVIVSAVAIADDGVEREADLLSYLGILLLILK